MTEGIPFGKFKKREFWRATIDRPYCVAAPII